MQTERHAVPTEGMSDVVDVRLVKDDYKGGGHVGRGHPASPQILRNPGKQFQNVGMSR